MIKLMNYFKKGDVFQSYHVFQIKCSYNFLEELTIWCHTYLNDNWNKDIKFEDMDFDYDCYYPNGLQWYMIDLLMYEDSDAVLFKLTWL
jgi:hypothetical protein